MTGNILIGPAGQFEDQGMGNEENAWAFQLLFHRE